MLPFFFSHKKRENNLSEDRKYKIAWWKKKRIIAEWARAKETEWNENLHIYSAIKILFSVSRLAKVKEFVYVENVLFFFRSYW